MHHFFHKLKHALVVGIVAILLMYLRMHIIELSALKGYSSMIFQIYSKSLIFNFIFFHSTSNFFLSFYSKIIP